MLLQMAHLIKRVDSDEMSIYFWSGSKSIFIKRKAVADHESFRKASLHRTLISYRDWT